MSSSSALNDRGKPAGAKRSKILLNAWILGALAVFFYFGYFVWNMLHGFISSGVY